MRKLINCIKAKRGLTLNKHSKDPVGVSGGKPCQMVGGRYC